MFGVFAGYGATLVRQGGDAAALEYHRAGENSVVPLSVTFPGDLYLFFAGVGTFEALGQDDRRSTYADELVGLFVNAAYTKFAILPAGRLPQVLRCALDGGGNIVGQMVKVYDLRIFQQLVELVLGGIFA